MSTNWDVWCLDCENGHGFFEAYHQDALMIGLAKMGPALGAFAKTMRAIKAIPDAYVDPYLALAYEQLKINLDWFEVHATHRLVARDEYGRCVDECGKTFTNCSCKTPHRCRRSEGHDGGCSEEREKNADHEGHRWSVRPQAGRQVSDGKLRAKEPGWIRIGRYDDSRRRALWSRITMDGTTPSLDGVVPSKIELCAGREGDDDYMEVLPSDPCFNALVVLLTSAEYAAETATDTVEGEDIP